MIIYTYKRKGKYKMSEKLTLTLNNHIINKAKKYAKQRHVSLSKLVEFYFSSLTSSKQTIQDALPPITNELSGLLDGITITNPKDSVADALIEKYL